MPQWLCGGAFAGQVRLGLVDDVTLAHELWHIQAFRILGPHLAAVPDFLIVQIARLFEAVGQNKTLEQAFAKTYGISLKKATQDVVSLSQRTQSNPAERVKGTFFEPYVPAPGTKKEKSPVGGDSLADRPVWYTGRTTQGPTDKAIAGSQG